MKKTPYSYFKFKTEDSTFVHILDEYKQKTGIKTNSRAIVNLVKLTKRFELLLDESNLKIAELKSEKDDFQDFKRVVIEYNKYMNNLISNEND